MALLKELSLGFSLTSGVLCSFYAIYLLFGHAPVLTAQKIRGGLDYSKWDALSTEPSNSNSDQISPQDLLDVDPAEVKEFAKSAEVQRLLRSGRALNQIYGSEKNVAKSFMEKPQVGMSIIDEMRKELHTPRDQANTTKFVSGLDAGIENLEKGKNDTHELFKRIDPENSESSQTYKSEKYKNEHDDTDDKVIAKQISLEVKRRSH
mmetsp:Transcript_29132/g.71071  ORF Transcript_29132/g.71071 Transcript_29132/m.71071 type:complete len:206 (-) Transcript_29132:124-741(-)|eukprot:CAMPEP_0114525324 /NCGR_PEP_ID=MMETSP0109-20121206/22355_1 /TAXON_ID=29199 /ORGANISM="Chlorarachnion reptans, Strain CCCM449" /LENGTH=205 /DNA_ID=CAMNT_0001706881 /DNA_START=182 /DNA_END=799 /DNA_ORIENTATION=-